MVPLDDFGGLDLLADKLTEGKGTKMVWVYSDWDGHLDIGTIVKPSAKAVYLGYRCLDEMGHGVVLLEQ
eukprot:9525150-Karenia_brevis.AAC.1